MSPEQARGEGDRVDGRSDIFSLGVVLYELLTGRRRFNGDATEELLEQITKLEVRPLRQWVDTVPIDLERICIKALSKRASDRYSTGKDMADDLRPCIEEAIEDEKRGLSSSIPVAAAAPPASVSTSIPSRVLTLTDAENPSGKRRPWILAAVMLILLLFLLGGAFLAWQWSETTVSSVPLA